MAKLSNIVFDGNKVVVMFCQHTMRFISAREVNFTQCFLFIIKFMVLLRYTIVLNLE